MHFPQPFRYPLAIRYSSSASCQARIEPSASHSFVLSNTEYTGRRAIVGNSPESIGRTEALILLRAILFFVQLVRSVAPEFTPFNIPGASSLCVILMIASPMSLVDIVHIL